MIMKRRGAVFAMISALGLIGYVCGSTRSNAQAPETDYEQVKPGGKTGDQFSGALSIGTESATEPAGETATEFVVGPMSNRFVSTRYNITLRDFSELVGQFVQAEGKDLRTLRSKDGTMYMGEVVDGAPDGHGLLTQSNGTWQNGEWRNGNPYQVSGTWVGPDGTREVGDWNYDGTPCGGTIFWTDGRVYKGDWTVVGGATEVPDGLGTMTWSDGRTYTGHFLAGKMDGSGKMAYPGGKIEDGIWVRGTFASQARGAKTGTQ